MGPSSLILIFHSNSGIDPSDLSGCGPPTQIVQPSSTQPGQRLILVHMLTYLEKKLTTVRDALRRWNKELFGKVETEIAKKKEELKYLQENINSVADVRRESEQREQLDQLLHREEILWSQKAGKEWDLKGDRNTKYFQTVVRNRRRHNRIIQIKNEEDVWISDQTQIQHCFCAYFQKLYADTPQFSA